MQKAQTNYCETLKLVTEECNNSLSKTTAKWDKELKLVQIFNFTRLKFLNTMGKCKKGPNKEELYFLELHEAVYLVEINEVELYIDEIKVNMSFALEFLLQEDKKFSTSHFRVYSYLKRTGLILTRNPKLLDLPFYQQTIFNVYQPGKFKKKDPGIPSCFILVLNQILNPLQISLCLEYSKEVEVVLALTDNTLKQNFVSLKKPKDINSAVHLKKPVRRQKQLSQKKEEVTLEILTPKSLGEEQNEENMATLLRELRVDESEG